MMMPTMTPMMMPIELLVSTANAPLVTLVSTEGEGKGAGGRGEGGGGGVDVHLGELRLEVALLERSGAFVVVALEHRSVVVSLAVEVGVVGVRGDVDGRVAALYLAEALVVGSDGEEGGAAAALGAACDRA